MQLVHIILTINILSPRADSQYLLYRQCIFDSCKPKLYSQWEITTSTITTMTQKCKYSQYLRFTVDIWFNSWLSLLHILSKVPGIQTFINSFECWNISKPPALKTVSQGLNVTQNSRLVLNIFSNIKEFIGGTILLHLQIISASLIQFYCIIFMGRGRDSQRGRLGDGEERGISPLQVFTCPESRQAS